MMRCFGKEKKVESKKQSSFQKDFIGKSGIFFNQFATHLPDQVVYFDHAKSLPFQRTFQGVLMFLDISGFTNLCEKFGLNAKYGTDKLTKTLSTYMGSLVQEILKYEGDVLKYAGDAILTLWPVKDYKMMKATVQHVIQCALSIQKNFGIYHTSVGVKLKVKLGIAAGQCNLLYVGNQEFCHYITMGRAVGAVNGAEGFCVSGDTVVAPSAWCFVNANDFEFEYCEDGKHAKVTDVAFENELDDVRFSVNMRTSHLTASAEKLVDIESGSGNQAEITTNKNRRQSIFSGGADQVQNGLEIDQSGGSRRSSVSSSDNTGLRLDNMPSEMQVEVEHALVRNSIIEKHKEDVNRAMRLYIAPPVIRKLDDKQPLEYLSEMRQVSMLFINLMTDETTKLEGCLLLQQCFDVIFKQLKKMGGCMNKIFVFDKGCTFLAIFGLPGYKSESDYAKALQCAHRIKCEVDEIPKIVRTSIGVTSGLTFCGVVGHDHRHEYTVIGRKVNMAARLMMHYPGMVTCDQETYHNSKLSKVNFTVQELKQMKGLQQVGTIREFQERETDIDICLAMSFEEFDYPIIGRDHEIEILTNEIRDMKADTDLGAKRNILAYEGNPGTGKSRLAEALSAAASRRNAKTFGCALTIHDSKLPYLVIRTLIIELLGIKVEHSAQQREEIIHSHIKSSNVHKNMAVLMELLFTRAPKLSGQEGSLRELLHAFMNEICTKYGFVTFVIDDAHYMDCDSWTFLQDMGKDTRALTVLTYKPKRAGAIFPPVAEAVLAEPTTRKVTLQGLQSQYIAPLACQLLKVHEIPVRLNNLLGERSRGLPLWCEQLLQDMFYAGTIYAIPSKRAERTEKTIVSEERFIQMLDPEKKMPEMICLIDKNKEFEVGIPDTMKGSIFSFVDRMNSVDQTLIKHAAILGMSFPRAMLEAIVPMNLHGDLINTSIGRLIEKGYIECAVTNPIKTASQGQLITDWPLVMGMSKEDREKCKRQHNHCYIISEKISCSCPDNPDRHEDGGYTSCKLMRFTSPILQETIYEMLVEDARTKLHKKAATFLESEVSSCEMLQMCGRSAFPTDGSNDVATVSTQAGMALRRAGISTYNEHDIDSQTVVVRRYGVEDLDELRKNAVSGGVKAVQLNFLEDIIKESQFEMQSCECAKTLAMVFPQLVRHWRFAGHVEKTLSHLLEGGAAAIAVCRMSEAYAYLTEVDLMLKRIISGKSPFDGESPFREPVYFDIWQKARLETLLGQAAHQLGLEDEAMVHFTRALGVLGNPQPITRFRIHTRKEREYARRLFYATFPNKVPNIVEEEILAQIKEQLRCLSHLAQEYMANKERAKTSLTILQQINQSKIHGDPQEQLVALINMIQHRSLTNSRTRAKLNEEKAVNLLSKFPPSLTLSEVSARSHLYMASLEMHLSWGAIAKAIAKGYVCESITRQVNDYDIRMQLLPTLSQGVMMTNSVKECGILLEELNHAQFEAKDMQGRAWYFCCVMKFMLQSGVQVEPFEKSAKFARSLRDDHSFLTDELPLFYLASCMTLWYARQHAVTQAEDWHTVAMSCFSKAIPIKFHAAHAYLNILEAFLIRYCTGKAMEMRQGVKSNSIKRKHIRRMIKDVKKLVKYVSVFRPRLMHLEAYFALLTKSTNTALNMAKKSAEAAEKMGNTLESNWANHSMQMWVEREGPVLDEHSMTAGLWDWYEDDEQFFALGAKFTLPLPEWVAQSLPSDPGSVRSLTGVKVRRSRRGSIVATEPRK